MIRAAPWRGFRWRAMMDNVTSPTEVRMRSQADLPSHDAASRRRVPRSSKAFCARLEIGSDPTTSERMNRTGSLCKPQSIHRSGATIHSSGKCSSTLNQNAGRDLQSAFSSHDGIGGGASPVRCWIHSYHSASIICQCRWGNGANGAYSHDHREGLQPPTGL